jgi:hypothetical protein
MLAKASINMKYENGALSLIHEIKGFKANQRLVIRCFGKLILARLFAEAEDE